MSEVNFKSAVVFFLAGILFGSGLYIMFNLPPNILERSRHEDPLRKIEKLKKKLAQIEKKFNLNAVD